MQDYHRKILDDPQQFGISVREYEGPQKTPCLMVEPSAEPGEAKKGSMARELLAGKGQTLWPWGEVRGTLILLHGRSGRKEDHLPIAERFCAAGFRCMIPDLPGHGDNPAKLATFGKNECELVEALADDLRVRLGKNPGPMGLFGVSQGGAIALQTAARPGGRWFAVVSVSTFSSLDQPIATSVQRLSEPLASMAAGVCGLGVRCRGGFFPGDISPLHAAAHLTIPAYIVHGGMDEFIPCSQGKQIYDAIPGSRKSFQLIPDGTHNNVLAKGGHAMYADLCLFYLQALEGDSSDSVGL